MPPLNDKDYIINVGPQGTFQKSGKFQTVPEDIDRMFVAFEQQQVRKISLYFHGGLVNEAGGVATAKNVSPYITNAGAAPVCFVWETGLIETLSSNISKISETKLFNKLLKLLLKKVSEKIGFDEPLSRGTAGKGITDEEIDYQLMQPDPFENYNRSTRSENSRSAVNLSSLEGSELFIEDDLNRDLYESIEMDDEFVSAINETKLTTDATGDSRGSRGIITLGTFVAHVVKIALRVISRFIKKRDHDLYPTIVEEILREFYIAELGAWVWKAMKDKAKDMWKSNNGRTGMQQYAGRYLLDKLAAYKQAHPDTTIHLIGHSAGSIVICHLLESTATIANRFVYDHIIFMAPACRIDLFREQVLKNVSRFNDLRIFTMSDMYESRDKLVPYFYTHSLLYLIAGILEDEGGSYDAHILGLERHIAYASPYDIELLKDTHDFVYADGQKRFSLSVTNNGTEDGLRTSAQSHGGFDDDIPTLESIQYILSN